MSYQFKAFACTLPVPEFGHRTDCNRLKEITIDCLTYRRSNPFTEEVTIWTVIESVWCNGTDIYELLAGELITLQGNTKGTLEGVALEYGQRVWSGCSIPGITYHPVHNENKIFRNTVTERLSPTCEVSVDYERIIHLVYINREDTSIDGKEMYFFQEPGTILINDEPAGNKGQEIYKDLYNRIIRENDDILSKLYYCLDIDLQVIEDVLEAHAGQLAEA